MELSTGPTVVGRGGDAGTRLRIMVALVLALFAGCTDGTVLDQRIEKITCPEGIRISARGNPIGIVSGHIRWCFPGEARCYCDRDDDCYAESGYVPCTPPGADAGTDAGVDVGVDASPDVRVDASPDTSPDGASNVCPEAIRISARGNPVGVVSGHIRWCFPGEARCHCDSDMDCYAESGYVPCTPPGATVDAGVDAPPDIARDVSPDISPDIVVDVADAAVDIPPSDTPEAVLGRWGPVMAWPYAAVHSSLLPDQRVLFWSDDHLVEPYLWEPTTGALTNTRFTRTELHCAGHSFLADGRLFMTGGEPTNLTGAGVGVADTNVFDFTTSAFTNGPTMRDLRWYPTNTTLPNGEVLVTAGTRSSPADNNIIPEVYGLDGRLRSLTGAPRNLETYPYMFVAPNGLVFQAGPDRATWYIDPTGAGRWLPLTSLNTAARFVASSVMYDVGKVMTAGGTPGGPAPLASVEIIDLRAATPVWTFTGAMAFARRDLNLTLLPDGTVLAIGGTGSDGSYVLPPEVWNPTTGTFTRLAPAAVGRAYHSESLLLADGRILFAGGNNYTIHGNAQVYSPPYLFRGPRPTITAAPTTVAYGASFTVSTPDTATVTAANWIRLGSVTHGFDQNQRINRLTLAPAAGGVTLTAPSDARLCPPGHYILFLLSDRGVPSVGRVIQIR